jgi:hypothetical protein
MPLPRELLEEMAVRRREESERADRDRSRDLVLSGLRCLAWSLAGVASILWSAHTTDPVAGRVAFWGGVLIGNAGITYTLLQAYRRGETRGDW